MDLNNIPLSGPALTDLYKNVLVEDLAFAMKENSQDRPTTNVVTSNENTISPSLKFLGENNKNISILVKYTDAVYLPDAQLNFLTNILKACKINLGDVAVINTYNTPVQYAFLKEHLDQKQALLFDVSPGELSLPVTFPYFQVQSFDGCTYLSAPSLHQLEDDKTMKAQLWNCLQKIFLS